MTDRGDLGRPRSAGDRRRAHQTVARSPSSWLGGVPDVIVHTRASAAAGEAVAKEARIHLGPDDRRQRRRPDLTATATADQGGER